MAAGSQDGVMESNMATAVSAFAQVDTHTHIVIERGKEQNVGMATPEFFLSVSGESAQPNRNCEESTHTWM